MNESESHGTQEHYDSEPEPQGLTAKEWARLRERVDTAAKTFATKSKPAKAMLAAHQSVDKLLKKRNFSLNDIRTAGQLMQTLDDLQNAAFRGLKDIQSSHDRLMEALERKPVADMAVLSSCLDNPAVGKPTKADMRDHHRFSDYLNSVNLRVLGVDGKLLKNILRGIQTANLPPQSYKPTLYEISQRLHRIALENVVENLVRVEEAYARAADSVQKSAKQARREHKRR